MTQEQKAKAYDEALEKAKTMIVDSGYDEFNNPFVRLFPELKKSEDERIRKALIHLINEQDGFLTAIDGISVKDIIAYLEKQKEQKPISQNYDEAFDEFMSHIPEKDADGGDTCYNYDDMLSAIQFGIKWQKEQQPAEWSEEDEVMIELIADSLKCLLEEHRNSIADSQIQKEIAWLEKQGGQKPAGKKYTFKVIPRLLEMIEPTDRAKEYCQKLIDSLTLEGYASDAKIVGGILKGWNGEKVAMATMDGHMTHYIDKDVMEAKIKKLLDYKENEKTKWYNNCPNNPRLDGEIAAIKGIIYILKNIDVIELDTKSPVKWSEEDESMHTRCIGALAKCYMGELPTEVEEELKWLKSLRPQPRVEWSKEDKEKLTMCCKFLHNASVCIDYDATHKEYIEGCIQWLKSIRPQPKQEWSEGDEAKKERLISIVKRALHGNEYRLLNDNGATELITWLKHLRPQPHWKPSEEQLNALYDVVHPADNVDRSILQSLLNDLQKLL